MVPSPIFLRTESISARCTTALLMGKLYDDRGNLMSPSFSSKNGVRYRFYVSSALLRGRKDKAGSVGRVAAREIEEIVEEAARRTLTHADTSDQTASELIERVVIGKSIVRITFKSKTQADSSTTKALEIPWTPVKVSYTHLPRPSDGRPDQKSLEAVVRAHAWLADLKSYRYVSIEELAGCVQLHPKVVRQALRLAFLAPKVTISILRGDRPGRLTLRQIPKRLPLAWTELPRLLG